MKPVYENKLIAALSRLADLIFLQLAFFLTSLPVFTMGAGLTALFSVSKGMREDSVTSPLKEYFIQFRSNFKFATKLWLLLLLLFGIAYGDAWFCGLYASPLAEVGRIFSDLMMVIVFLTGVYALSQGAWFENPTRQYLKNGLLLALSRPGTSVLILSICGVAFVAAELVRPLFFLFGVSGTVYLLSILLAGALFGKAPQPRQ